MKRARGAAALIALALLFAGCSETVSGHGAPGGVPGESTGPSDPPGTSVPPTGTGTPPAPTATGSAPKTQPPGPAAHLACPRVIDSAARLTYDCIARSMQRTSGSIWPVKFIKDVDINWSMDEGSSHVDVTGNGNVTVLANGFVSAMGAQEYGPNASVKKESDVDTTVDGRKAHLVESLITISPAYRAQRHLKVAQERLWVVVVQIRSDQFSAWYVSIPDLQKALWPNVPSLIKRIKVV